MRAPLPRSARGSLAVLLALAALAGCTESEAPDDETNPARAAEIARIVPAAEALAGAEIPKLDPAMMNDAEIQKALGAGSRCSFHYSSWGKPILAVQSPAVATAEGVVKLNGNLVMLRADPGDGGLVLTAEEVRLTLAASQEAGARDSGSRQEAQLILEIGDGLRVGYGGYYVCGE